MKSFKLIAASLLASAIATSAFAANVTLTNPAYIRVIGSTAFRAAYHQAIENAMGGPGNYTVRFDGSNDVAKKFNAAIFYGTIAGQETIVKTYWTGSIAGIIELAQGEALVSGGNNVFPADTEIIGVVVGSSAALPSPYGRDVNNVATVSMADNPVSEATSILSTAAVSASKTAAQTAIAGSTFIDAGTMGEQTGGANPVPAVALVDFQWVLGANSDAAPFTNITQQQAAALIQAGYLPLAAFTGNAADKNSFVFFTGRNEDSGTRNAAFSEAQTGFGQSDNQVQVTGNPVTALAKYPITGMNLEPLITWNALGHSGYNSGSNVATALSNVINNPLPQADINANLKPAKYTNANGSRAYMIGYLGISDVGGVTGPNNLALTYNGVAFSEGNVQNGSYSFWNYEHNYYLTVASAGNTIGTGDATTPAVVGSAKLVADAIADQLYTADAEFNAGPGVGPAGTFINAALLVKRSQAGAPVVFK